MFHLEKALSSREDVQVFTSLPPKVQGDIKCFLRLQISRINWLKDERKKPAQQQLTDVDSNVLARCVWWGEDPSRGSIFRPRLVYSNQQNALPPNSTSSPFLQTVARYMIRSGPKQFKAYLNGKIPF